ncbi:MAG: hypothetical protein JW809_06735 [Pirellulales bacterium]|nr:hypothetical protein [Pirellulales bacterium]
MFHAVVAACAVCLAAGVQRDVPSRVVQGEFRCRVLLIDFEGREHVHSRESFEALFFGDHLRVTPGPFPEPTRGSARDFFREISDGRVLLKGEVMPWVRSRLKPEELPHWSTTRDGDRDWWQPVAADAMSLNNIPKDDRIDGKPVDFYAIVYAGPDRGYFKCLDKSVFMGAGRRSLSTRVFGKTKVPYWEDRWNGKQVTFSPERWRQEPSGMYGVGLHCHEFGHMLCGFRDLYGAANGDFGNYAVMAYGEKTHFPTGPIAYHRYAAGWLAYDVPERRGRHPLKLPPLELQRAVKLVNGPMPWADALIVEHRARWSPHDRELPAEGLLVYETYGKRQVRTVRWDAAKGRPVMQGQWIRLLRADGSPRNEAGDVFREGNLSLFGAPSAASSATGCGFWELEDITLPAGANRQPATGRSRGIATFHAVYCPKRVVTRGRTFVDLTSQIPPGDHRVFVQVAGGPCAIRSGDDALLEMPAPTGAEPVWGLLDVQATAARRPLRIVPGTGARIEDVQIAPRAPVLLNLLAEPHAARLAASLGGRVAPGAILADNVCAGGAIEVPLGAAKGSPTALPVACPGGTLRLALRAFASKGASPPKISLVVAADGKKQKLLGNVALRADQPEFFLIDCRHPRDKAVQVELSFKGPEGSRVALWEAGFAGL